jgi:hypothetical protein
MPRLHDSVTYCEACDHYVAQIEITRCEECGAPVCPDCALPTTDPDLSVCSRSCQFAFRSRAKQEAA